MNYFALAIIPLISLAGMSNALSQTIVSVSPTFGQPNTYVTISGYSFLSSSVVRFGTIVASARLTGTSGGGLAQIQATVPAGLSAPVLISVQNPGGAPYYSSSYFTNISNGPFITDFSPSSGNAGTPVTINGANFANVTKVTFGGVSASFSATVVNKITATAPVGVLTGPITVTTTTGTYTSGANFYAPPSITSFTPASGTVGTSVKITGQNFTGVTQVSFGNVPASFVVSNNTQIVVYVPEGVTNALISVGGSGTSAFSATAFAVTPTIFGFSPPVGQSGTPVTITGLSLSPGSPQVSFGGSPPVAASSATYNQIIVLTPSWANSGPIKVTTANGSITTTNNYLVPPTISSFAPNTGRPGTSVDIKGNNFTNATSIAFHGAEATFSVISNGLIRATVPLDANSGQIVVTTPAGSVKTSSSFFVPPVITSFTPVSGSAGTDVTISGSFPDGVTNVLFNKVTAPIHSISSTEVKVTVPVAATTGPITVIAVGGTNSSTIPFTMAVWLKINSSANNIVNLSWPTNAVGFTLQYRTNISSAWAPLTNSSPKVVGDQNVLTNTSAMPQRYYRLKK